MEKTLLALATLAAVAVPAWATMPLLGGDYEPILDLHLQRVRAIREEADG